MSDRAWAVVVVALLILAACAFLEWLHQRRDKRGRLSNVRHVERYHPGGWRSM